MAVDLDDVGPAVVVVVDEAAAPRHVVVVDANAGCESDVAEGSVAVVVVQVARVVGEVGLEDVEPAIAVVVGYGNTHASLLMAVVVVGAAGHYRDVGECAVVIVLEQDAWLRIDSDINVGPAVVVEVVGDRGDGIARTGLQNARLLRDIGEGAVSVVVIKDVRIARKPARAAHRWHALPLAEFRVIRRRNRLRVKLDVVADEQIEMAVPVVIEKGTAGAPAILLLVKACLPSDIGKRAVSVVVEENVVAPEAAEQVIPAVVVVVANADAGLPSGASQS